MASAQGSPTISHQITGQVQSKRRDSFLGRIRDFSRADPDANVAVREPGRGDRSDSADRNSNQERSSNPSSTFHAPETVQEAFNSRLLPNEWLRLSNAYSDYTPLSIPREEYIAAIENVQRYLPHRTRPEIS